ncbi:MAG: ABC transporter ATP-binding protein [Lachnospiraceae bacterium]|nr:ABC transporter ATP-binding protein [Lachnospiraceae bacterium]
MKAVEWKNVTKQFSDAQAPALRRISVAVEEGEFVCILGRSGCGKTTLIKLVNRLLEPDEGEICLFGVPVRDRDPVELRRGIGYVIQQVGLFPHMKVYDNVATLPRILKWDRQRTAARVDEMLSLVDLDPSEYRDRYPSRLSGGQQQRVGLARALIADPKVCLFDEPFGAIDAITRENLQNELLKIHRSLKRTYLFVTHDIREALKLGTKVMILHEGQVVQYDSPEEIVRHPAHSFVRDMLAAAEIST